MRTQKPTTGVTSKPKQGIAKAKRTKKDKAASVSREPYAWPQELRIDPSPRKAPKKSPSMADTVAEIQMFSIQPEETIGNWPKLFTLKKNIHGNCEAALQGRLKVKFAALTANVNAEAAVMKEALEALIRIRQETLNKIQSTLAAARKRESRECHNRYNILSGPSDLIRSLEAVVAVVKHLKDAIGPDLHTMWYFRKNDEHVQAANRVVGCITKAVKALNERSSAPRKHGNKEAFNFKSTSGVEIKVPLPWLAIEYARQLVEEHQRLPLKFEIRAKLASHYDELKEPKMEGVIRTIEDLKKALKVRDTFWAGVYSKAGLSDLEEAAPWEKHRRRQVKTRPPSPTC